MSEESWRRRAHRQLFCPGHQSHLGCGQQPIAPLVAHYICLCILCPTRRIRCCNASPRCATATESSGWVYFRRRVAHQCPERIAGRDLIWFIDNEAAASTLIRGVTREDDVQLIAEATHLLWAALRTRVWIEWIDSKSNPSDGLSRDGLEDSWCRSRNVIPRLALAPAWSSPEVLVEEVLRHVEVALRGK